MTRNEQGEEVLRFAHQSVREYLLRDNHPTLYGDVGFDGFQETIAHQVVARICLIYLLSFDTQPLSSEIQGIRAFPLYNYAAAYWMKHIDRCGPLKPELPHCILLERFLDCTSGNAYAHWIRVYNPDSGSLRTTSAVNPHQLPSPLYCAVLFRWRDVVRRILQRGGHSLFSSVGGEYGHPLHLASWKGDIAMVRLLLEEGADVTTQAGVCGYALQAAANGKRVDVARLLLEKGADVNAVPDTEFDSPKTALQEAATYYSKEEASLELVTLLVEKGADVNQSTKPEMGPLVLAASSGVPKIVRFLLDHGAERRYYGHALQLAARCGHCEVVELLLDHGVDVNWVGGRYRTALKAARENGRQRVVQLLLEYGATEEEDGKETEQAAL